MLWLRFTPPPFPPAAWPGILCLSLLAVTITGPAFSDGPNNQQHPIPQKQRQAMAERLQSQTRDLTAEILKSPDSVTLYSQRGDTHFFLGNFKQAIADYEQMVKLDSSQDRSHWRRGIARFYGGQFKQAAHQFEIYHMFDDVDRENGIWRYFSQYKAHGARKAKAGLLKYRKDDREPFPAVYQLFSGKLSAADVLTAVKQADISKVERSRREFYSYLYVGLNHALEDQDAKALQNLRAATANTWGRDAGFGPNYMWHVGRLHYELLLKKQAEAARKDAATATRPAAEK